ncbi:MAG: threonine synthase [Verrucomicrobia bacterium A1]|nr:MAG: threonine synthase [Verrucomicrobia bacterium A1]
MNGIHYRSTNRGLPGGSAETVSFREALLRGPAPDGGLYMPCVLPRLDPARLAGLRGAPYARVACEVLRPFTAGTMPDDDLLRLCEDAYDFDVPVEPLEDGVWILRLDRGPTASFKDFAARWMARMMRALRKPGEERTILVATSGDTGSAVGEAFRGLEGFRVVLLYPERGVSAVQKRQLDGIGLNVRALSVAGTFDECQALVKQAFLDPSLAGLGLSSANSINIGRILPQSVYYVYAWLRVVADGGPVTFSVPSGNFGNSFGCELARRMGLPVARLILAVNANDEFPRFLAGGGYRPVSPSRACLSNAMNVGNPSNLARYFDVFGGILTREGTVRKAPDVAAMRAALESVSIGDDETVACIRDVWTHRRVLLEPHGAVGVAALRRLGTGAGPAICLETAHPAKFPEMIERELGFAPPPPAAFRKLAERTPAVEHISATYEALRETLTRNA